MGADSPLLSQAMVVNDIILMLQPCSFSWLCPQEGSNLYLRIKSPQHLHLCFGSELGLFYQAQSYKPSTSMSSQIINVNINEQNNLFHLNPPAH